MIALLVVAWFAGAIALALILCRAIAIADEIEQPELPPVERHLPREWVA